MRKFMVMIVTFFIFGCGGAADPAKQQIEEAFINLTEKNPELKLISVVETTTNNYVVEVRVPDTMEVSKDSNSREQNLVLTKKWSALVCTRDVIDIATRFNINFLSVKQIDNYGELHSMALCG